MTLLRGWQPMTWHVLALLGLAVVPGAVSLATGSEYWAGVGLVFALIALGLVELMPDGGRRPIWRSRR